MYHNIILVAPIYFINYIFEYIILILILILIYFILFKIKDIQYIKLIYYLMRNRICYRFYIKKISDENIKIEKSWKVYTFLMAFPLLLKHEILIILYR